MKSQNTDIDAMKDTTGLSNQLKIITTEKEGQYYIKNKQFPINPFITDYIKYVSGTDEYIKKIEEIKDSPALKMIQSWIDPIQTPNRLMIAIILQQFPSLVPTIQRITDNWQYPDTPSSPSEQLLSKDGYDIGGGTIFKCNGPFLNKYTNFGKPEHNTESLKYTMLPDEIPYFEFIDKENPCSPCILMNEPAPPCQFKIAGSSPDLFKAIWGTLETEKNAPTNSFSGFDAATATDSITTKTKQEDPAVTASDQNKQVAQNDADAKKADLDVELKQAEVNKAHAEADNASKSTWEKTFG